LEGFNENLKKEGGKKRRQYELEKWEKWMEDQVAAL